LADLEKVAILKKEGNSPLLGHGRVKEVKMAAPKIKKSTLTTQIYPRVENRTVLQKPEALKTLIEWKAPVRAFKKMGREYFTTLGAFAFFLSVVLLLVNDWLLVIVIVALMFVTYVMGTIPPGEVEHKITNRGAKVGEKTYEWPFLTRFWFTEKWGQKILNIETMLVFPQRLIFLLGSVSEEKMKKILSEYLPLEEPEKTWVDKTSQRISRWIPLERT
jgi:hypothetical protein